MNFVTSIVRRDNKEVPRTYDAISGNDEPRTHSIMYADDRGAFNRLANSLPCTSAYYNTACWCDADGFLE